MKNQFLKKTMALALAGAMTLSMAACGKDDAGSDSKADSQQSEQQESSAEDPGESAEENSQASGEEAPEEGGQAEAPQIEDTTIKIRVMNEFRNLDKVLAKYQEMTADDPVMSKIHPEFAWVAGGDYKDKLTTAMIGQEDFDLMFCGGWHGLSTFIQDGNFADLSSYFGNDAFPGLKNAFSEDFVQAMTSYIRQEDGSYQKGIYGINLATFYEDSRGFMYREDLRKKYDCAPITDETSLLEFVKTVQENEEGMIGVSLWNFFRLDSPWYSAKHDHVYTQDNVNVLGDQTWIWVGLSEDEKTVLNAVVPGDSPEEFAKMPVGYQDDFITAYIQDRTKWNPYLNPNRGGTDTVEKPAAIAYSALSEYESKVKTALETNPDEEYGFYVIEDAQRNMEPGAVVCDMATNNWLVVPEWSEKTDAVMYFLDWMFGSQEAHDLFELGIEGEDWEAVGEDGYKKLDIDENLAYSMPTYSFTQNPTYIRVSEFVSENEEIKSRFDYMYDPSTYKLSPLAGFVFDTTNVETQIANVSALSNELQLTISMYDADEAAEKIQQWHTDAEAVGLEEIRAELISQIQAFLDAKNAN
ncbi:ABC transporter substrate-binding protein [uncultured Acetatifactor sp.]|uniref:ABC transporter substrate-binding protein n=1 Tax=uncultured Acetatifactor sp. TaxID=1671927 RepID=UPI00261A0BCC|nr:ABC transporter substrate-binding protein [uncultured Acetatifactor sp.]